MFYESVPDERYLYESVNKTNELDFVDDQRVTMVIHGLQQSSVCMSSSSMTSRLPILQCAIYDIVGFMATRWRLLVLWELLFTSVFKFTLS